MLFAARPAHPLAVFLLYNALAFACQPLVGWLIDEDAMPGGGLGLALGSLATGFVLCALGQPLGLVPAACGSALFHAGAGALAGRGGPRAASSFTAPGVLGLALGTAAGLWGLPASWGLMPLAALLLVCARVFAAGELPLGRSCALPSASLPGVLMLILLTAMAMRSLVWDGCQLLLQARPEAILLLGTGAAAGKLAGGPLAERWGWRRTASLSLLLAIPALVAGSRSLALLTLGAAALQLSTPITLCLAVRLMASRPATAAGLALGLSLALGGLPLLLGLPGDGLPLLALMPALLLIRLPVREPFVGHLSDG